MIRYLEKETERAIRGKQLLLNSKDNPLRPMYDKLLEFAGDGQLPKMNIVLNPPVSEEEIIE